MRRNCLIRIENRSTRLREHAGLGPARESLVYAVPAPEFFSEVAPRAACAGNPRNSLDKFPVVDCRSASASRLAGQQLRNVFVLVTSPRNSPRTMPASQKKGCKQIAVEGDSAGRRLVAFGRQPLSSPNVEVCSCITCTAVPHLDAVAGEGSPSILDDHLCTGKDITISICRGSENRSLATRRPVFPVFQG